jgi:L-fucose isomerase-like protein
LGILKNNLLFLTISIITEWRAILKIGIYHLISEVHDSSLINDSLKPFLASIEEYLGESMVDISLGDIKRGSFLPILMIKSGGVEEKFKRIYQQFPSPYLLIASCLYNSLPAALEIKEYLQKRGEKVIILHGSADSIANQIKNFKKAMEAKKSCRRFRVGVLGKPSDWLIASGADYNIVRKKLGIRIYDIPIEEMIRHIDQVNDKDIPADIIRKPEGFEKNVIQQSLRIYQGLKNLTQEYNFNAITVRCFDLLDFYKNTGCLALSLLNKEGIIAGCEGDVPALISMIIANQLTEQPTFIANLSCINQERNDIIFCHCTIPINMCESYEYKTHFESGMGIAVRGKVKKGPVTIFKINGNVDNYFLEEGELTDNLELPTLCRSQLQVSFKKPVVDILEKSIANHHIICKGWYRELFERFFSLVL